MDDNLGERARANRIIGLTRYKVRAIVSLSNATVVRELDTLEKSSLKKLAIPNEAVIFYAERADLTALAGELASGLGKLISKRQAFDPSTPQVDPSSPVGLTE